MLKEPKTISEFNLLALGLIDAGLVGRNKPGLLKELEKLVLVLKEHQQGTGSPLSAKHKSLGLRIVKQIELGKTID